MSEYRYGGHTVSHLTIHLVWVTKYRYKVLTGGIQTRCRELLIQFVMPRMCGCLVVWSVRTISTLI